MDKDDLAQLTEALLGAARTAGAEAADALAVSTASISVDVRDGALEQAERSEGTEIGLRVFAGQKQASTSGSDLSQQGLRMLAERAVAMAQLAPDDPFAGLADPDQIGPATDSALLDLVDPGAEPDPASLQAAAGQAEAAALDQAGISQVQATSAGYSRTRSFLAATNGLAHAGHRTSHWISCVAIAGEGLAMEREYDGDSRVHHADLRAPGEIGHEAASRALAMQGARKAPTGQYPVLFDERIASSLIGHLLGAVNGAAIARGASWLRGALDQQVLPQGIDLIEDPLRPRVPGSRVRDAEGLPTKRRALIDQGRLTGWTLDLASGRKLGMASTANAARGLSGAPAPRCGNVSLTQTQISPAELMRDMGTGLLVTGFIGATINPNTGDYSRGISGHWIENGEISHPVNECTIAGNLRDMMRRIVPANDARQHLSRVVPSLLVDGMTLAGA